MWCLFRVGRIKRPVADELTEIVQCPACSQRLRVPLGRGRIRVACPSCRTQWVMSTGDRQPYRVIDLVQGTDAWHDWRYEGLGASDAPIVIGENPWKSRRKLMLEKRSRIRTPVNSKMARGTALEPEARRLYEETTGVVVRPVCLQSTTYDWLRASVDGLSEDRRFVVEIKCGESVYEKSASTRRVPRYYLGQLQHILAVTGLEAIDFWCYLPQRPIVHLLVERDEDYINKLLVAEEKFWNELQQSLT